MALKPTIYKFRIALTDLNRDYYDSLNLTVALHPSETNERMMARIMAFCLNAHPDLQFTKGISTTAEPDIWQQNLEGRSEVWIELGEPDVDRVKKATRVADVVKVYTYQVRSDIWWNQQKVNSATFLLKWCASIQKPSILSLHHQQERSIFP